MENEILSSMEILSASISKLISVYTEGKKLDVKSQAIDANYRIEEKRINAQLKIIQIRHQETMKKLQVVRQTIKKEQNENRKTTKAVADHLKDISEQANRCFEIAIKDSTPEEKRQVLLDTYYKIQEVFKDHFKDLTKQQMDARALQNGINCLFSLDNEEEVSEALEEPSIFVEFEEEEED